MRGNLREVMRKYTILSEIKQQGSMKGEKIPFWNLCKINQVLNAF
jgi:hypothetical protein